MHLDNVIKIEDVLNHEFFTKKLPISYPDPDVPSTFYLRKVEERKEGDESEPNVIEEYPTILINIGKRRVFEK